MNVREICSSAILGLLGTSLAFSATVVPSQDMICTRDLNPWRQSSICSCPDNTRYDQRIGYCVEGPAYPATVRGEIETGVMAVGGETSGIVLESLSDARFDLVLSNDLLRQLEEGTERGQIFEVEGEYIELPGTEIPLRPSLIVSSIRELRQGARQSR